MKKFKHFWLALVSLAMILGSAPASIALGEEGGEGSGVGAYDAGTKTVYVLTSTLESSGKYLIVNANSANDSAHALGHNNATVAGEGVVVKDGISATNNQPYIESVDDSAIWTVGGSYTFKNGDYYLYCSSSGSGSSATYTLTCNTSSRTWTLTNSGTNLYYKKSNSNSYYFVNYGGTDWTVTKGSSNTSDDYKVYFYKETAIETHEHNWEFQGFQWEGATAKAVYTCTVGNETTTVDATVEQTGEIDATCTEPGKIEYTASVSEEKSLDGTEHSDSSTVTAKTTVAAWGSANSSVEGGTYVITFTDDETEYAMYLDDSDVKYAAVTEDQIADLGDAYKWTANYNTSNSISGWCLTSVSTTAKYLYYGGSGAYITTTTSTKYRWSYDGTYNRLSYEAEQSGGTYYYVSGAYNNTNPALSTDSTAAAPVKIYAYSATEVETYPALGHDCSIFLRTTREPPERATPLPAVSPARAARAARGELRGGGTFGASVVQVNLPSGASKVGSGNFSHLRSFGKRTREAQNDADARWNPALGSRSNHGFGIHLVPMLILLEKAPSAVLCIGDGSAEFPCVADDACVIFHDEAKPGRQAIPHSPSPPSPHPMARMTDFDVSQASPSEMPLA